MKKYWGLASPDQACPDQASPDQASLELANPAQTPKFATHYRHLFRRFANDEKGSAIVEFVVLAIPLFIPIVIYLASFASLSGNEARRMAEERLLKQIANDNSVLSKSFPANGR